MKFSFMSFSCPELGLSDMLSLAKELGYDGIEPRAVSKHAHGVEIEANEEQRQAIRSLAEESGIAIACIATSCVYADPAKADQNVDTTLEFVHLAADVGCPTLRVFGGKMGEGLSREDAIELVGEALKAVADHAEDHGVTVCMETHDDWCDPKHVAAVMEYVSQPSIAVNWDIMHPVRTGHATMEEAFEILKPWVRHIHFHDGRDEAGKLQLVPIGEGIIDHKTAVSLLKANGYDGFLSGEWIGWEPYQTHLPRELATMKRYEREAS
jgi:fatty-acyl-CoA synthase